MARLGSFPRLLLLGGFVAFASPAAFAGPPGAPRPAARAAILTPEIAAIRPISGPAGGGAAVSIFGANFAAGATVTIGDVPAAAPSLVDAGQVDAVTPALTPGSVNDVVVSVPGQDEVTLDGAYFARFADVAPTHLFARAIEKLRRAGITTGCGGGNYCPSDAVTRAQMAVFILRGKHGSGYHPPPATGTVFDDVPATALFADWIEQFAAEGITSGCGVKRYCPNQQVTRGEMAVFILRARHGSAHQPPPPTGVFDDVPPGAPFAKWIEELSGEAITSGCGGGNFCPTGPNSRGEMAVFLTKAFAGSVQEEIAFDLADGVIDDETALLYRFYALFQDDRLPTRYWAARNAAEDPSLFGEARRLLPDLSPAGQAAIAPFLARPDDPASPFGPAGAAPGGTRRPDVATQCPNPWISLASAHFRVHTCPSVDPTFDQTVMSSVSAMAESLWTPMTAAPSSGMGPPLGDCFTPQGGSEICPGGDGKLDVYLLGTGQCRARDGYCWPITGDAVAMAVSCDPEVGNGTSGYMLLSRSRAAGGGAIKTDFAHEFFHVLQFRHNADTGYTTRVRGRETDYDNWFVEASAVWAEWRYVPETAADEVHTRFPADFLPSRASLLSNNPPSHPYASYIWPFFAQQEKGSGAPVFDAWVAAEGAGNTAAVTDAVDQQLKFEDHFRDFAVRNWNQDLPNQPISPLYKDLPPSSGTVPFPDGSPPFKNVVIVTPTSPKQKPSFKVNALAAQYDEVFVDDHVKKVVLRFKDVPAGIDVDLLVKTIPEKWERRKVNKAEGAAFCRDKPGQRVERLVVILSNHEKRMNTFRTGNYEVEKRTSCCTEFGDATSVKANVSFNYSHSGDVYDTHVEASQSAALAATLTPVPSAPGFAQFEATTVTGTGAVHDRQESDGDSTTLDGSGPPTLGSGITLSVDLTSCTCLFGAGAYIDATYTPPGSPGNTPVGAAAAQDVDVGGYADKVVGSGSFPAHSSGGQSEAAVYVPGGFGILYFIDPANEDSGGSAGVSWSFEPVLPPGTAGAKE